MASQADDQRHSEILGERSQNVALIVDRLQGKEGRDRLYRSIWDRVGFTTHDKFEFAVTEGSHNGFPAVRIEVLCHAAATEDEMEDVHDGTATVVLELYEDQLHPDLVQVTVGRQSS